jgi:hypothetical protein
MRCIHAPPTRRRGPATRTDELFAAEVSCNGAHYFAITRLLRRYGGVKCEHIPIPSGVFLFQEPVCRLSRECRIRTMARAVVRALVSE